MNGLDDKWVNEWITGYSNGLAFPFQMKRAACILSIMFYETQEPAVYL